jgi:predicted dehydrogenase
VHYGDIPAVIEASYFVPGTWRDCLIVGELGALAADFASSTVTLHLGQHVERGGVWEALDLGKEVLPARSDEPLRLELEAFLDACAGRSPNQVPAGEGVRALAVVEAAERAACLGTTVTVWRRPDE